MAILTRAGRAAISAAIKSQALHLAWGRGDAAWTVPPAESAAATALIHEVGRRTVTSADFVVADVAGDIEIVGQGKWSVSATPTNNLFVVCQYDFADASDEIIREIGLFTGTVTNVGLPAGQRYFTPAEITSPGFLLELENREPIYRSAGTRERFELLITF